MSGKHEWRDVSGPRKQPQEFGVLVAMVVAASCLATVVVLASGLDDTISLQTRSDIRLAIAVCIVGAILLLITAAVLSQRMSQLRHMATTDPLTGLLSRAAVTDELAQTLRGGRNRHDVAVLVLDLDGFKEVNDRCGHSAGDQVLKTVADRLRSSTNGICSIGRLGGDEFIIIATAHRRPPHFPSTWRVVMDDLSKPIEIAGEVVTLGASAGVSLQYANQEKSPEQMLHEADVALYTAKESSDIEILEYRSRMRLQSTRESERRRELQAAIDDGQFEMHFQPEIDLRSGELIGAEALLRWNHRQLGVLAADHFIEDLERFSLLADLLPMLLSQASTFANNYTDAGFTIRVNVAAEQLSDPRILPMMQQTLVATPGVKFCLEVTERSVLDASTDTIEALRGLRSMGIMVALDDFGTGYASLKQLHDLPVDAIKIDRTFVNDLQSCSPDESIAAIIIDLGSLMDLEVVAEGIETLEQSKALSALGCTRGQGYLIGRPIDHELFLSLWPETVVGVAASNNVGPNYRESSRTP